MVDIKLRPVLIYVLCTYTRTYIYIYIRMDFKLINSIPNINFYSWFYQYFVEFVFSSLYSLMFLVLVILIFCLFISSRVTFFRVIISLVCMLVYTVFLCFVNADYFAAFLIAAEIPIMLISLLFYFSKHSLQVDSAYSVGPLQSTTRMFLLMFFSFGFLISVFFHVSYFSPSNSAGVAASADTGVFFSTSCSCRTKTAGTVASYTNFSMFFDYALYELMFSPSRNDFYLLFVVYYNINSFLTFVIGFLLFLVSCVVIFVYFSVKKLNKLTDFTLKNTIFLRKQSMLRQASTTTRLRFFKRKKL